jgi:UDP-2,4-diacetamido-2,4,6-trideoxy-beta-L-altropyranose hydrolase
LINNKKPNILFKIEGGEKVGLGHVYRSFELSKEFTVKQAANVVFFSNFDINSVCSISNENNKAQLVMFKGEKDEDIQTLLQTIHDRAIDIVIIDQQTADRRICSAIKQLKPEILTVGLDFFDYDCPIDVIINLFNQNMLTTPKSSIYLEGVQYAIIREDFRVYRETKKTITDETKEIVITYGGADPNGNTLKTLNLLNQINGRRLIVNVVLGKSFPNKASVDKLISKSVHECRIVENSESFESLISRVDLGFCGGGTTQLEFCAVGTPVIVYPQTQEEERFARYIEKNGACKIIIGRSSSEEKIETIKTLINNCALRRQMSNTQKTLVDMDGKKRIKTIILSKYENSSRGTLND